MTAETQLPAIVTPDGEVIRMELTPMSATEAGSLLGHVQGWLAQARRLEGYLLNLLEAEMRQSGQTERRAGDLTLEFKGSTTWVVDDGEAMGAALLAAHRDGQVTRDELALAAQQRTSWTFNHARLNALVKRVPAIDELRRKVTGDPRISVKR
jgi:hypothetical protein